MKSKDVLKILKVTRPTLCRYVHDGKISVKKLPNGFYDYADDDVFDIAHITKHRSCVIYARVSTQKQKKDLQNQIDTIRNFANSQGYVVENVYSDIASGLNFDRGEFKKLLLEVIAYKIKTIFISNKDRLTRVSFNLWKQLFAQFSCELIVINNDNESTENSEKELYEDIISLLHCFAMKIYSPKRKKKITLIKEDLENEIS